MTQRSKVFRYVTKWGSWWTLVWALVALALPVWAGVRAIRLPAGFRIRVFASGLGNPRFMAFSPAGDLFVTVPGAGMVLALPDYNHDGKADRIVQFATGLDHPHGIAFAPGYLYIAETGRVIRFRYPPGSLASGEPEVVVPGLPTGGHWTRTLGFGPEGKLYVSVGSSCNVCEEEDPRRAAILQFNTDGSEGRIFARGLRNAVGFVWHPESQEMWATDNGRDWLGDDLPPDEINIVRGGEDYGWPYCYGQRLPDPEFNDEKRCQETTPPVVQLQAHSAPLGLAFYTGKSFPETYWGDLFVAFHGSWNRSVPTGYKVIRIQMRQGQPQGVEAFATAWLSGSSAWGRPVDLVVGPEGALYVSDDRKGAIYRIFFRSNLP